VTLTGKPLLLVAALAAVALPVACLWYWSRPEKLRRGRTPVRLSLFMSSQLAAVLVVGLALNDYGQFYASWADLLGTGPTAAVDHPSAHFGGPDLNRHPHARPSIIDHGVPEIPAEAATWNTLSWSSRSQWAAQGAIVNTQVTGPASGLKQQALVYLPPRYFRVGPDARRMPVVEVLTGFPGDAQNLVDRMHYPDRLAEAIAAGSAQDMVLVMMRPAPTFPWDTECSDVPGGPQTVQFFTEDVPASIIGQFGLQPTGWGVTGDSTGGYCSAKIAMMDPARFPVSVVLSGYFKPSTDLTTRGIFTGNRSFRNDNDLTWRMKHLPVPSISMLIATARDERGADGYNTAQSWLRSVRAPMSADELLLDTGGHNFRTWGREIPFALQWLSDHLPAPS
jgi:S-formylglutathione hydrolase FrmB